MKDSKLGILILILYSLIQSAKNLPIEYSQYWYQKFKEFHKGKELEHGEAQNFDFMQYFEMNSAK